MSPERTITSDDNTVIKFSDLQSHRGIAFDLAPDAQARESLAEDLGAKGLRKLRFKGNIAPLGKSDWQLTASLGASLTQSCVITLDPVTTRIDEPVTRQYLAQMPELSTDEEIEMPEDDTAEPLPVSIDLAHIMAEALSLAAPAFPRIEGATHKNQAFSEPGTEPLTEEAAKPFANLKDLMKKP